nr:HlyD family efflux transporter periplasmic adaptor subunit [Polyangiaceae bacterium]
MLGLPFEMSLSSLRDRDSATRVLTALMVLLTMGWAGWMFFGTIPVYATSTSARIEVEKRSNRIDAPSPGRLLTVFAKLGANVEANDVLFVIDHELEKKKIEEHRGRLSMIEPEMQVLERVLQARGEVIAESNREMKSAVDEGKARERSGASASALADDEAVRVKKLYATGTLTEVEWLRSLSEADRKRAEKQALSVGVERIRGEFRTRVSYEKTKIEELRRELLALDTQRRSLEANLAVLETEVQKRIVRAPLAGVIAELGEVNVGGVVKEGDRLCSILPDGALRAVGQFDPSESLGRIKKNQSAQIRLDAFPWGQYGTVRAKVTETAREVRE